MLYSIDNVKCCSCLCSQKVFLFFDRQVFLDKDVLPHASTLSDPIVEFSILLGLFSGLLARLFELGSQKVALSDAGAFATGFGAGLVNLLSVPGLVAFLDQVGLLFAANVNGALELFAVLEPPLFVVLQKTHLLVRGSRSG